MGFRTFNNSSKELTTIISETNLLVEIIDVNPSANAG